METDIFLYLLFWRVKRSVIFIVPRQFGTQIVKGS